MQNIDFEKAFDALPHPVVLIQLSGDQLRFCHANSAFFSSTNLSMGDLLLSNDWLDVLRRKGSNHGALTAEGMGALEILKAEALHTLDARSKDSSLSRTIDGISFIVQAPPHMLETDDDEEKSRNTELAMLFNNSIFGAFFMASDEPIRWDAESDKLAIVEYLMHHLRITRVNQAMLDQYHADKEDFIGRTPYEFFQHDIEQERVLLYNIFEKGKHRAISFERDEHGNEVVFEGDYVTLYDGQHRITGVFGIQQNITKRYRYVEQIKAQNTKLREIAWIQSHVVRSPVARILSIKQLLSADTPLPESEQQRLLDHLFEATHELDGLISDIVKRTDTIEIESISEE